MPRITSGVRALDLVRKFAPNVTQVRDAKQRIEIEVTPNHARNPNIKQHGHCVMAEACKERMKADHVIVSRHTAYVVKGDKAVRYAVPESVTREVVSFDRHAGFQPGHYHLAPVSPSRTPARMKAWRKEYDRRRARGMINHGKEPGDAERVKRFHHQTANIRTSLR